MSSVNPYPDPTEGKSGSTLEILETLTIAELETYISHLTWEQANRSFTETTAYTSRSYYRYRSTSWIQTCRELIALRK
ncbi:MAG: hypothetical protein RLZZ128_349 [Actinomycetota bacterium]|jgi:hypothetical protein